MFDLESWAADCVLIYRAVQVYCFHRELLIVDMDTVQQPIRMTCKMSVVDLVSNTQPYTLMSQPLAGYSAYQGEGSTTSSTWPIAHTHLI